MPAPKKYNDELRERATRLAVEARRDPASAVGAFRRGGVFRPYHYLPGYCLHSRHLWSLAQLSGELRNYTVYLLVACITFPEFI